MRARCLGSLTAQISAMLSTSQSLAKLLPWTAGGDLRCRSSIRTPPFPSSPRVVICLSRCSVAVSTHSFDSYNIWPRFARSCAYSLSDWRDRTSSLALRRKRSPSATYQKRAPERVCSMLASVNATPARSNSPGRRVDIRTPKLQITNAYRYGPDSVFEVRCEHRLGAHTTMRSYTRSWDDFAQLEKTLLKSCHSHGERPPRLERPIAFLLTADKLLTARKMELEKWLQAISIHPVYGRLPIIAAFFALGTLPQPEKVIALRKAPSVRSNVRRAHSPS